MPRKKLIENVKRVVVKVGTSSITENGIISNEKISVLIKDIVSVIKLGYQVVIVSSGAITAGAGSMNRSRNQMTIPEKQAYAAIGQAVLINEYRKSFKSHGYDVGQILLTEDDIRHRRRFLNARNTLDALLNMGVIPVINENDTVVVKEIKIGDNDTLSAHVSCLINADLLVLLSDVDGFYYSLDDDEPVEEIYHITNEIVQRAGGSGSDCGTGGMMTKIKAAEIIIRFGEMMIIANSRTEKVLSRIMHGEKIGTIFVGKGSSLNSKKRWLSLRKSKGRLTIDQGAVEAIIDRKKSLLATGISDVSGHFDMGDIVQLIDAAGTPLAQGMTNYNHEELVRIMGQKTGEIKKTLGSKYYDEVINRDDLIIF